MAVEYKAYALDPDGHVILRTDLVCADDVSAKQCAQRLAVNHSIELWQGKRLVGRFEPLKL